MDDAPTLGTPATFRWERDGALLIVTLNRPDRLNALSRALQLELAEFWPKVQADSGVRCVIVTGAGRAFSAGADIADLTTGTRPRSDVGVHALDFCPGRCLDVPVIVAVNGLCVGGALNFLSDADIVVASEHAWFTDPHVSQGQVSGPEMLQLAAKTSFFSVTQMALSGSALRVRADRALAAGLVAEVVPHDRLLERAKEIGNEIAAQSPTAVRATLRILRRRARGPIAAELDQAWAAVVDQWSHPDAMEGPAAFAERRAPRWADPLTGEERNGPDWTDLKRAGHGAGDLCGRAAQVMYGYARAVDERDLDALGRMVTDDVRLTRADGVREGRAAFVDFYRSAFGSMAPSRHFASNVQASGDGGLIRVQAYFQASFFAAKQTQVVTGSYADTLREERSGLRIAEKVNNVEFTVTLPAAVRH
jgi:enoyl-CoA hydratase/carnithine racemase/ketosteroid isomerase-like protein